MKNNARPQGHAERKANADPNELTRIIIRARLHFSPSRAVSLSLYSLSLSLFSLSLTHSFATHWSGFHHLCLRRVHKREVLAVGATDRCAEKTSQK